MADTRRETIINAAQELFAQQGFAATSISKIAAQAMVAKSLIFHHFKDKEDLWKEVKQHLVATVMTEQDLALSANFDLHTFLEHTLMQRYKIYAESPAIMKLIQWQALEKDETKLVGGTIASPSQWYLAIEDLQERNQMRKDVDADLVIQLMRHSLAGAFAEQISTTKQLQEKYVKMVIEALYRYLRT